jgi:nucleotide-binding universal stress UspA family protein
MIQLKRVLLPTDFSASARRAFAYAASFAREYGGELYLLHVIEVLPMGYASELFPAAMTQVVDEISSYARDELQKLADEALRLGCPTVQQRTGQGKPSSEIARVAREESIDMIVLGTHGHGVLNRALFGSTADGLMRKAPCPVLVCRLSEHEPAKE